MPLREFGCEPCGSISELYHPSLDPAIVPVPECPHCRKAMQILFSVPHLDTADTFHPFEWRNPVDGKFVRIASLHQLRKIEHDSLATGHNVRFDAYSAEPSNPNAVDGYGLEHWDGKHTSTKGTGYLMPTMK